MSERLGRRGVLQLVGASAMATLAGCSISNAWASDCINRTVDPRETGSINPPTSDPTWTNWGRLRPILRPHEHDQPNIIHNPIPILWKEKWYMYAIDGDDGIGPSILSYKNVNTDLYKRGSDGAWNLHENNVLTGVEVNDVCVVDDTIYAYAGQEGTVVYTGKTPTDLTKRATVAESIGDPGCHYDPNTGDFHLYYEQGDPGDTGFSGERIGHSVSPDGINDWEHLEPVVDTTDTDFDVGDPRLIKVGDTFHLFVDYNREETLERIAHYYGSGYSNFERDQVVVTGSQYNAPSDERAVSHPFANGVGDGSPRFIDGVWKLFFEANTDCGGEIWVAESTGPTPADDYEIETVRRYRPIN